MTRLKIFEVGEMGSIGMDIEVTFKAHVSPVENITVIHSLSSVLNGSLGKGLNVGVEQLIITPAMLNIKIIYSKVGSSFLGPNKEVIISAEDLSRIRANFVFYLFAVIDQVAELGEVPFPQNFRYFINLLETVEREYGWQ